MATDTTKASAVAVEAPDPKNKIDVNMDALADAAKHDGRLNSVNAQMAMEATLTEHELTLREALRKYHKACLWSMLVSMSIIMRAYGIEITGNFLALPAFKSHLGDYLEGHGWEVPKLMREERSQDRSLKQLELGHSSFYSLT